MYNVFEGKLVRLRALEPGDAETLFAHLQDNEISRRDASIVWPRSLADIRSSLEKHDEGSGKDDKDLVIETLDGTFVGGINTQLCDRRNGTYSVGIGLSDRS